MILAVKTAYASPFAKATGDKSGDKATESRLEPGIARSGGYSMISLTNSLILTRKDRACYPFPMHSFHLTRRVFSHVCRLALPLLGLATVCAAQELEPRRWSHLPINMNFAGIGYGYTRGEIFIDPVLQIENAKMDLNTLAAKYIRSFDLFGHSARIDLIQAAQSGHWEGLVEGVPRRIHRDGLSDSILRFAYILHGAPPLRGKEYAEYRASIDKETLVGAALAVHLPTGDYDGDKPINLGNNRFTVRPQLGVVHNRGKWSMEVTGSAWIFTDNTDFYGGHTLEQSPLFTLQGHVDYTFRPGLWIGSGLAYGYDGEARIDGVDKNDEKENLAFGIKAGYAFTRTLGAQIGYIGTRSQNSLGADTDTVSVSTSIVW